MIAFTEYSIIGISDSPKYGTVFYGDTSVPAHPMPPDSAWQTLDLGPYLPCPVDQALLRVWTPIQRPSNAPSANCTFTAAFRAPGSTAPISMYAVEAMCSVNGSGVRQQSMIWCPVVDNKLEWVWTRSTQGAYPPNCSYGANIELIGYARNL